MYMMGIETLKNIFTSKRSSFFEGKNGIVFETIKDIFHTSKHRKETQVLKELFGEFGANAISLTRSSLAFVMSFWTTTSWTSRTAAVRRRLSRRFWRFLYSDSSGSSLSGSLSVDCCNQIIGTKYIGRETRLYTCAGATSSGYGCPRGHEFDHVGSFVVRVVLVSLYCAWTISLVYNVWILRLDQSIYPTHCH